MKKKYILHVWIVQFNWTKILGIQVQSLLSDGYLSYKERMNKLDNNCIDWFIIKVLILYLLDPIINLYSFFVNINVWKLSNRSLNSWLERGPKMPIKKYIYLRKYD